MAAKSLEQKIDALTSIVEKGFAAVAEDIGKMATKDDVRTIVKAELNERLIPITDELVSIRRDLDRLTVNLNNVIGYRKEIDHALDRIAAIEKHLGINKKIAA